jgi:hypothetical protein
VKQTTTSAVLVMKAHNFTDKQRADSFLDQVMKQIVDNWQTNVPQYKGKVIKVRKQEDHQSQDVLTRRIEFSVGKQ